MKKIFLILAFVFLIPVESKATVVNPVFYAKGKISEEKQNFYSVILDQFVGMQVDGCQIISVFYDDYNSAVKALCIKNGRIYKIVENVFRLSSDCGRRFCPDARLPLFEVLK